LIKIDHGARPEFEIRTLPDFRYYKSPNQEMAAEASLGYCCWVRFV